MDRCSLLQGIVSVHTSPGIHALYVHDSHASTKVILNNFTSYMLQCKPSGRQPLNCTNVPNYNTKLDATT